MAKLEKCDWCGKYTDKPVGYRKSVTSTLISGSQNNIFCSNKCKAEFENNHSSNTASKSANESERHKADLEHERYKIEKEKMLREEKEEKRKHEAIVEEQNALKRKKKADTLRGEGKNFMAFLVGINPTYLAAGILVIAGAGIFIFKKVNKKHSNVQASEYTASLNTVVNKIQTSPQDQPTTVDKPEEKDNVTEQISAESNELTPQHMVGSWKGEFGKNELTLTIESIDENGNVKGFDELKGNRRNLDGKYDAKDNGYTLTLNEPGDDEWDGVFECSYNNSTNEISGQWKSNNGKSTKAFLLTKK